MIQPLSDIVVVDLTENLAGPFCTQILADMGAEVIKVERPDGGDPARAWGPPFWDGAGTLFLAANRNKRSIAVDLKTARGRDVLARLVRRADVLVQSFRPGTIDRLGFGYDTVRELNPRLIYTSVTAFGARGTLKDLPGYDPLLQAYSGLLSINGHPGQEPARVGTSVVDLGTGMWAALGVMGALRERERTGEGCHVGAALYDTALAWVGYHLMGYFATGRVPTPQGTGLAMIAPYEAFPTADGRLLIAAANDGLFRCACQALGLEALLEDDRFADNRSRVRHRAVLVEEISRVTRRRTTRELQAALQDAGVPCAPIRDMAQVAAEPHNREAGIVREVEHPRVEGYREVALPVEWDGRRPTPRRTPPRPGEHTEAVLRELGYTKDEVREMERGGVVALRPARVNRKGAESAKGARRGA